MWIVSASLGQTGITSHSGFMFARSSWIVRSMKILYDLLLYKEFVSIPPAEEGP
jgi:hypothetical protein